MLNQSSFRHVSYLWEETKALALKDEVDLFIYRSNLLGADLRLTNYGGGNTSVKIQDKDPLTGDPVEVMWIKGSGGDIGTLKNLDVLLYTWTDFWLWSGYIVDWSMKTKW